MGIIPGVWRYFYQYSHAHRFCCEAAADKNSIRNHRAFRKRLADSPCRASVDQVKAEGAGFINVYLSDGYFRQALEDIIKEEGEFARSCVGNGHKVLVEFVSANPTGPLSVAHARQAAVGDALANILALMGFDVSKEYYLNDEGNQINILGRSVEARLKQLNGENVEFPQNYYQGDYIIDIARHIKENGIQVSDFGEFSS